MPSFCAVVGCDNKLSRNPDVTYHHFPRNTERLRYWIRFCGREDRWIPQKNQGICSCHFNENSYDISYKLRHELIGAKMRRTLNANAIPGNISIQDTTVDQVQETLLGDIEMAEDTSHESSLKCFEDVDCAAINEANKPENSPLVIRALQSNSAESELELAFRTIRNQAQQIIELKEVNQSLKLQLDQKRSTEEKLTNELSLAKLQIQQQQQFITDLKLANSNLASQHVSEGKAFRKQLYNMEKQLRICELQHMDHTQFVKQMKLSLREVLSENQVDVILGRKQRVHWTSEEISKAFAIRVLSKRCYVHLRNELKYPLPGISTLQDYARRIDLKNGLLRDVLRAMDIVGQGLQPQELACIITFDEMSVRKIMEYDQQADEIVGPYTHAQIVMVRGLFSKWKQVIFVAFDQPMTEDILNNIIKELHNIRYNVVGITSDNGPDNISLRNRMGITIEHTHFDHPVTQEKIYVFGDAPHNLKLVRNWFVGEGIVWKNRTLNTRLLRTLINERANCELTPIFALNNGHLELSPAEKQNVSKAAKLLSHTTAAALRERFQDTEDMIEANHLADFVEIVNNWFDVFNSFKAFDKIELKQSYKATGQQLETLDNMWELMFESRGIRKGGVICKSLAVFQKSILMSIVSLKGLFTDMEKKYAIKFVSTYKLNQDLLENLISQIRTRGGLDDRPAPLQVLYRLRLIILGKNPGITHRNSNTIDQDQKCEERDEFITAQLFIKANVVPSVPDEPKNYVDEFALVDSSLVPNAVIVPNDSNDDQLPESLSLMSGQEQDGFIYILGWIAYKLRSSHPELGDKTANISMLNKGNIPSFLARLSYGGLTVPSPEFESIGKAMEKIFILCQGTSGFKFKTEVLATVERRIAEQHPNFDKTIIQKFVKIRTIVRMRYGNLIEQGLLKPEEKANDEGPSKKIQRKRILSKSCTARKYKKLSSQ